MTKEDKEKIAVAVAAGAVGTIVGCLLCRKKVKHQCAFCGLIFETRDELMEHLCTHCPEPSQWVICYATQWWYQFSAVGSTWQEAHDSPTGGVGRCWTPGATQTGWIWYKNPAIYRCGIYFDLSPLPAGKIILSANLNVNVLPAWKFGDGACTFIANEQIFFDFPNHAWPPVAADYGKFLTLTDEIIRVPSTDPGGLITVPLPQHTINTMQGMPRLAIAEMCSGDKEGPAGSFRTIYGCCTYHAYSGYRATLYVELEP